MKQASLGGQGCDDVFRDPNVNTTHVHSFGRVYSAISASCVNQTGLIWTAELLLAGLTRHVV